MKQTFSLFRAMLFLMVSLCMPTSVFAVTNVTTTAGGQLQAKIEALGGAASVTELTISGPLNGTDIDYLHSTLTKVTVLNLSNARIVAGGDSYHRWDVDWDGNATMYEWDGPWNTENDVVGDYMFSNMPQLTTLTLPTTLTAIGANAFSHSAITEITVPTGVTTMGNEAFMHCEQLQRAVLPEGLTAIPTSAFNNCYALEEVNLPSTVESIGGYAFYDNHSRTSALVIPAACKTIGECAYHNNVLMPSVTFNGDVESIGGEAFSHCKALTTFTFPQSITEVPANVLLNCESLTSVTLAEGTTRINGGAFSGCFSLTSINLNQASLTYIGGYAFMGTGFTAVTLPNTLSEIEWGVFYECQQLTSINIPTAIDYVPGGFVENCPLLTTVTMHDGIRTISDWAFSNCTSLATISLNDQITTIGSRAFKGCTSLVLTKLPDALTTLGEWALGETPSITGTLTIPTGVTAIGSDAFNGCGISTIVLHDGITEFGSGVFANTPNLSSINLPSAIDHIPAFFFFHATALQQITLPATVREIHESAFSESGITSIALPEGIELIGNYAFSASQLQTFSVPDGYTNPLGYGCFENCKQLKSVYMGRNQDYSQDYYFSYLYGCDALELLRIHAGTPPPCEEWAMGYRTNCVLEVPEEMISLYQGTDIWKDFKTIRGFFSGDMLADADFAVMQDLYNALGGANWKTPWNMENNHHAVGKWNGIITTKKEGDDQTYVITDIDLSAQQLNGSLPASVFRLAALKTLKLNNNTISGNLTTLLDSEASATISEVDLHDNCLTGDIYPFASKLTGLTYLDLSYNQLTDISQPISNEKLGDWEFIYNFQFMKEATHALIDELPADAPVTDMTVGVPTALTFSRLVTYRHNDQDYDLMSNDLGHFYWTGGMYDPWDVNWSFYQTDGLWNLYQGDDDYILKAVKNKVQTYTLNEGNYRTILLRLNWTDGDVNADQTVDILDLQSTVFYALNDQKPNAQMFNFGAADANGDEALDVRDVVGVVDYVLGAPLSSPQPGGSTNAQSFSQMKNSKGVLPNRIMMNDGIVLANTEEVAALQLFVSGTSARYLNIASDLRSQFSVSMRDVEGGVRVVIYSAEGHTLAPGEHSLINNLPAGATITDIRLSDMNANRLAIGIDGETTGIGDASRLNDNEKMRNDNFFNLNGQKVAQPTKGLYLKNGKKVIYK